MANGKRVALVTGGAIRVGRAIVRELAEAGYQVAIHHRTSTEPAQALVEELTQRGLTAWATAADLNDPSSWPDLIARTVERFGRLDALINNAAMFGPDADTLDAFDPAHWERTLRLNLLAPVALIHHARVHLAAHGAGKVVNLCDICAERPWPDHLSYCASKAALVNVTKALARTLAPAIQVNAIAPGIAVFPDHYDEPLRTRLINKVPLGRAGTPEEIAQLTKFLVASGGYITGQVVSIDGGRSIT